MTFLKNIHKKRRTGPTPNKVLNKYPRKLIADSLHARFVDFFKNIIVKSINFENLKLTMLNSHLLIHIFFNSKLLSSLNQKMIMDSHFDLMKLLCVGYSIVIDFILAKNPFVNQIHLKSLFLFLFSYDNNMLEKSGNVYENSVICCTRLQTLLESLVEY